MSQPTYDPPVRNFVPDNLDAGDWSQLQLLFDVLQKRPIADADDLARWIDDVSELESAIDGEEARRYIAMTCHTDDAKAEKRYTEFQREVRPRARQAYDQLDRRYLALAERKLLDPERFGLFDRYRSTDAEIFREENLPLEVEESGIKTRYTQLVGAMTVEIDGEELPLPRAALELEEPDRARREAAWRKMTERRSQDAAAIESMFEELLALRQRRARNAGFPDYRALRFREFHRFDYDVKDCEAFHAAVESSVVPAVAQLNEERQRLLSLSSLRPWDLEVGLYAAEPFRPFSSQAELCGLVRRIFREIDPRFESEFAALERRELLDLESRPHKAPGGYQYFLEDDRVPFIFANAAGTHDDVQTLLHEGGHAFHSLACRDENIVSYRNPPLEFCEVASMGMELMGFEHLATVYPGDVVRRVRASHLERTIRLLAWIATVDAFQHWVYTHEGHSVDERRDAWGALLDRFSTGVDWSGLEESRRTRWHRQGHIFRQPFYYIEYGIAQLGALELWTQYREDPRGTTARYRRALAAGGSRGLRSLFELAGLRFDFSDRLVAPLIADAMDQWRALHRELTESTA